MRLRPAALSFAIALIVAGAVSAGDQITDGGDISRVNKSISVAAGSRAGDLDTVNGSISVGADSVIESADTVNGSVRVAEGVHAEWLETVNGSIGIGARASISEHVETVNGSVTLAEDAEVAGNAETVNGSFKLAPRAHIGGQIVTHNGDITLHDDARVDGGILVKKSRTSWFSSGNQRIPVITIGPRAQVGDLTFEREVELKVHESARIGAVSGASVQRFGGEMQVER